ncbi:MAG: flagellar biosynthetic protein FliO [Burkholderiaceae bacterium]|nr:flagellar biosynthetic protein FliO [Burkholderiaceae bacterium]
MTASMLPSLIAFAAVLLMIPAALWLARRAQGLRQGGSNALAVVGGLTVGPRERIAVVRAAGSYLVVGITGQSMTLLATLDDWPVETTPAASASAFASLLNRVQHGNAPKAP